MFTTPLLITVLLADPATRAVTIDAQGNVVGQPTQATAAAEDDDPKINGVPLSLLAASLDKKEAWAQQQRAHAMTDIARYAPRPTKYLPSYTSALQDPEWTIRATAAQGLGQIGKRLPSLVPDFLPPLAAALDDSKQEVREQVIHALDQIGPAARAALPALRARQTAEDVADVKQAIDRALLAITKGSEDYQQTLQAAADNQSPAAQWELLKQLSRSPNDQDKKKALDGLRKSIPGFLQQEQQYGAFAGREVMQCLVNMGPFAKPASEDFFAVLAEPIKYRDVPETGRVNFAYEPTGKILGHEPLGLQLRLASAWAITKIDPDSIPKLAELLARQLADPDPDVRLSATIIAGRLSYLSAVKKLAPAVEKLVEDTDPRVRSMAHLARVRMADPNWEVEDQTRYGTPRVRDKAPPAESELRARLKPKLAALRILYEAGDGAQLLVVGTPPEGVENLLLQSQFLSSATGEGAGRLELYRQLLSAAKPDEAKITGPTVVVPTDTPRKFDLYCLWFDGDWYLAGSSKGERR